MYYKVESTFRIYVATSDAISHQVVIFLQLNDPETIQRLANTQQALMSKGYDSFTATDMSYKVLDFAVTQQSYLLSYLDGFRVISVFFICAIPLMFLLRNKKMDAAARAKVAEESH